MGNNIEEKNRTFDTLEERVRVIKDEVDALQINIMNQKSPWYKNVPAIISILALCFSFGTTYVSYNRIKAQDIISLRAELRSVLQRLMALPKENFELTKKYTNDPLAIGFLGGYINQENSLLARQAAEIANKLPKDKVSAAEYYAIAMALQASYNVEGAERFLDFALVTSKDFNEEIAILRAKANIFFLSGQPEAGRMEYRKALNIFAKYQGYSDFTQKSTHIWTELNWSISEANIGALELVGQHIAKAEKYVSSLLPGPSTEQLRGQISQTKIQLTSMKGTINPSNGLR